MRIGLFGVNISSDNKGVMALGYSQIIILQAVSDAMHETFDYYLFGFDENIEDIDLLKKELKIYNSNITFVQMGYKSIYKTINVIKTIRMCDVVLNLTGGDSFSDIYGVKRFVLNSLENEYVFKAKTPLIMAPQTFGPFKTRLCKNISKRIIKNSIYVFSRDEISAEYLQSYCTNSVNVVTDVAFALPYVKKNIYNDDKIHIGLNISGLLWNGGYTGKNQLGLTINYREYCKRLVKYLIESSKYHVHLIPHVICHEYSNCENDVSACEEIARIYPRCVVAPSFKTPIEAKNYISTMNIFIGSRMHATIAAFSSGVVTIPVAYSRKFIGLFRNLGYNYVIDACKMDDEMAYNETISYINNAQELKSIGNESYMKANELEEKYKSKLLELLTKIEDKK